jgi:hypothetical protein
MRPIDFVVFDGDSSPNDPAYKVAEAMMKPITVRGVSGEFVILSYYMDDSGNMVLDIEPREDA